MPLPHERAAIDAAIGDRRERLIEAASVLDRVRAENPGVKDPQSLPPEVRREALAAVAAFQTRRSFGPPEVAALLMLMAGPALLLLKPHRVFQCEARGQGVATCTISDRALGVLSLRRQTVESIASTETGGHSQTSESRDSQGRLKTTTTHVGELAFKDAGGADLWRTSESRLLGATIEGVAASVNSLLEGDEPGPLVRAYVAWPALLGGTLFFLIGASGSFSALGLFLRDRGFISVGVYRVAFYWGALVAPLLLCAAGWVIAFLGGDPPAWLIRALLVG